MAFTDMTLAWVKTLIGKPCPLHMSLAPWYSIATLGVLYLGLVLPNYGRLGHTAYNVLFIQGLNLILGILYTIATLILNHTQTYFYLLYDAY